MDFLKEYAIQIIITIVLVIVLAIIIYIVVLRSRSSSESSSRVISEKKDTFSEVKTIIIGENPNPHEMTATKLKDYDMIKLLFMKFVNY